MKKTEHTKNISNVNEATAAKFLRTLNQISLSSAESESMRENLIAYSNLHAAHELDAANLESSRIQSSPFSIFSFSYVAAYPRAIIGSTLILLILISGTGVSYASQNSLPGQTLYDLKVSVVEPLQTALIINTIDQAHWQNQLTQRRLSEAATLAAQNKLATSTQEYLSQQVSAHVALAQSDAASLSAAGNVSDALTVRSDLEAQLTAHADFLTLLAPRLDAAGDATTSSAVVALLTKVTATRDQVEQARVADEVALVAGTTPIATTTSSVAVASSTPSTAKTVAIANATIAAQDSKRKTEVTSLLQQNSELLNLLPVVAVSATTSTSTTVQTAGTVSSSTIPAIKLAPPQMQGTSESTKAPVIPQTLLHASLKGSH